jgi:hypothetical protein
MTSKNRHAYRVLPHTTQYCTNSPKGLNTIAQGCRAAQRSGYPGSQSRQPNQPRRGSIALCRHYATPSGSMWCAAFSPRVVAARQPWAALHNPFGIITTWHVAARAGSILSGHGTAAELLASKTVVKATVVPGRLVNFVVK